MSLSQQTDLTIERTNTNLFQISRNGIPFGAYLTLEQATVIINWLDSIESYYDGDEWRLR